MYENDHKRIWFSKGDSYRSLKRSNKKELLLFAKQHYGSFLRNKNKKSVKQSEISTYQPKTFQIPNTVDMKSVITEHPKIAHKLSKKGWKSRF